MLKAIKHGLGNLANVRGRDARQAFWYYVLFIYIVTLALSMAVSVPLTIQAVMTGVQQGIASARYDPATAQAMTEAAILDSMSGLMAATVWVGFASGLILLLGLAASLVRRLHDSGLSGYWAAIPGVLQAVNLAVIPSQFAKMDEMMTNAMTGNPFAGFGMYQGALGLGAVAGWGAIIAVIVMGVRKSTEGPNRYGEAPFTA